MEDILRQLSELQMDALARGISFTLDLHYVKKDPVISVSLNYTADGGIQKAYVMNTHFDDKLLAVFANERIDQIKHFIYKVVGQNKIISND